MYLILFVLNDPDQLNDVLCAWEDAGIQGITILPSTGLGRIRHKGALRDDLPLFPGVEDILNHEQDLNRTLFSVVEDDAEVERIVAATQNVVGDLEKPNSGILIVLPVAKIYGKKDYSQ